MTEYGGAGAHRVFLRQALGGDEYLRVTWHEAKGVFVFSHWAGATCTSATPVRVSEIGDLATMAVAALAQGAGLSAAVTPWPAPDPESSVDLSASRPA